MLECLLRSVVHAAVGERVGSHVEDTHNKRLLAEDEFLISALYRAYKSAVCADHSY